MVIFLFQTCSRAFVSSAFVQERGGPPRGAECWLLARLTGKFLDEKTKIMIK